MSQAVNVTQLDQLLYAWLAQTDERKFDQAFQRYYAQASPNLVRYLARRSNLQDLDCEQIAIDALLKFFCRVGRDRREAAESISAALPRVRPLNLGPFHARHVERWTGEVGEFRQASMTFKAAATDDARPSWKTEVQAQIDAIPPLQNQGVRLLESVRCATSEAVGSAPEELESAEPESAAFGPEYPRVREFAARLSEAVGAEDPTNDPAEARHPGIAGFVGGAWTVVEQLPTLRIPTNGYLFDIAQSLYLDECKARGRKKRGGGGQATGDGAAPPAELAPFVLEDGEPEFGDDDRATVRVSSVFGSAEALAGDPAEDPVDEDFCERFYDYLRKPLTDAEDAYARAVAGGKGAAERKRLESVSAKHARLMSILSMRIEGHTQEAIAEALDLSRNQVKYMAEQVQEAYRHFCAAAMRV